MFFLLFFQLIREQQYIQALTRASHATKEARVAQLILIFREYIKRKKKEKAKEKVGRLFAKLLQRNQLEIARPV